MRAQGFQRLIKVRYTGFSAHGSLPVCEVIEAVIGKIFSNLQSLIPNLAYPEH
jgi:predicted aldo/keto reductase-like oxidoreductase